MDKATKIALYADYSKSYYRRIVDGVARYSRTKGWRFYTSRGVPQISLDNLKDWNGQGVIGRLTPEIIADLQRRGIPAVNVKSDYLNMPVASVLMDNERIGALAAEYFLDKGINNFVGDSLVNQRRKRKIKVARFYRRFK